MRREVRRRALWDALAHLSIVPSQLGDEAGPNGAAALFLESIADFATILDGDGTSATLAGSASRRNSSSGAPPRLAGGPTP